MKLLLLIMFGAITARLISLQLFERGSHVLMAETNRVEVQRLSAPRGVLYDRNGTVLVRNIPKDIGITREYLLGEAGAHLLGYISEVREEELGCREGVCYTLGDSIGRMGSEKVFEQELRGHEGGRLVEVDSQGAPVREIGHNEPQAGRDVVLSIDVRMQKIMFEAMQEKKGSVVALDMNGKVMGLVSVPSFDPNVFTAKADTAEVQRLLSDTKEQYFFNRAISGTYPPGSVFKLVTAYAGLMEGAVKVDETIEDTGEIRINEYRFGNWYFDKYGKTEGVIDLRRALARSNDVFFYRVGENTGIEKLVSWARRFGYAGRSGIELPSEAEGLVPDPLWKERYKGETWYLGNTYHLSIGQGDLLVTPLQVARMTMGAVSGRLCQASLLKDKEPTCVDLGLRSEYLAAVREGMRQACAEGGTAFPFFHFAPSVICKTGTAQHGGEETKPHAWFTVAYPGDNPTMVMTVMLEEAGEGSEEAAPVAKRILEKWKEIRQ